LLNFVFVSEYIGRTGILQIRFTAPLKIIALAKKRFLLHYLAQINLIGENNGIKI
jgi:hypothetical protein